MLYLMLSCTEPSMDEAVAAENKAEFSRRAVDLLRGMWSERERRRQKRDDESVGGNLGDIVKQEVHIDIYLYKIDMPS